MPYIQALRRRAPLLEGVHVFYLYVAVGGAFGSLLRYCLSNWIKQWAGTDFPWATFTVNILGSFLMGVLLGLLASMMPRGKELYLLIGIGALGGFTTFSTFSYDAYMLLERGDYAGAGIYVFGSVAASVAALLTGMWLFKLAAT